MQGGDNKIMTVRKEPVSLGYERLAYQAGVYPDLALFVSTRGWPQFVAETTNDERHYLILYYVSQRQAFACRTLRDNPRAVEFAGPYPITEREQKVLKQIDSQ